MWSAINQSHIVSMNVKGVISLALIFLGLAQVQAKDENNSHLDANLHKDTTSLGENNEGQEAAQTGEHNMHNFEDAYFADPDADFDLENSVPASQESGIA